MKSLLSKPPTYSCINTFKFLLNPSTATYYNSLAIIDLHIFSRTPFPPHPLCSHSLKCSHPKPQPTIHRQPIPGSGNPPSLPVLTGNDRCLHHLVASAGTNNSTPGQPLPKTLNGTDRVVLRS